jgi:glycine C-acetyltransferase
MASVRFICGTQDLHKQLEANHRRVLRHRRHHPLRRLLRRQRRPVRTAARRRGRDHFSDALNHASIIDGVRLCKARRYRYANCDMADLETQLKQAKADGARTIMITSDGVFSMDGFIAPLDRITALAREYGALVHIDECHATGFLGATGRGSAEVNGVMDRRSISSPGRSARRWAARSAASPPASAK